MSAYTHLDKILATTRATVVESRERTPVAELHKKLAEHEPRGWASALRPHLIDGQPSRPGIIAELKKASPSKGLIREDFDVSWLARRYVAGGAAALSILTDEPYFQGSLQNLQLASAAVEIPCLRKDFIVDEYQILEARANSADAILLIAAALSDHEMQTFARAAHVLSLDVLCEVHNKEELARVLSLADPPDAIGVNNRDLHTFEVRLETSLELVRYIPSSIIRVAESGIATPSDLDRLRTAGFDAFLIGESLMRQADPAEALQALLAGYESPAVPVTSAENSR